MQPVAETMSSTPRVFQNCRTARELVCFSSSIVMSCAVALVPRSCRWWICDATSEAWHHSIETISLQFKHSLNYCRLTIHKRLRLGGGANLNWDNPKKVSPCANKTKTKLRSSSISCLMICVIQLWTLYNFGGTWRRTCSPDIQSVSALRVFM